MSENEGHTVASAENLALLFDGCIEEWRIFLSVFAETKERNMATLDIENTNLWEDEETAHPTIGRFCEFNSIYKKEMTDL